MASGLTKSDWENHFVYEGWILDVAKPSRSAPGGRLVYRIRVGFSEEECIEVLAIRSRESGRLVKGAAARVTGRLRFIRDDIGRVQLRVDASKFEIIQLKPES